MIKVRFTELPTGVLSADEYAALTGE
jgi:hypothetical protein